jgi:1-aminocyclopropane-1-carboxylate deaminase/D-cysteine desulfhydrase-like pyridoxal-dependent ACC family enzyme
MFQAVPLQIINDPITQQYKIKLYLLRMDLNHPHISGNKPYKLKYNLQEAEKSNKNTLLTFGGAFSNHIAATAAAGKEYGFKTIGIIRGEAYSELNSTLKFATECGMELHYVPRNLYQNKTELHEYINTSFAAEKTYIIPEGGANELGVKGCKEITNHIAVDFNYITCACGTGTTLAGIIQTLKPNQQAIGFQVLNSVGYIEKEVKKWIPENNHNCWSINEDYHFGGYAKIKKELTTFMNWFQKTNAIPLDYIYTGKMMFGIYQLIQQGFLKNGETVIAIHTGGLQGNKGFTKVNLFQDKTEI